MRLGRVLFCCVGLEGGGGKGWSFLVFFSTLLFFSRVGSWSWRGFALLFLGGGGGGLGIELNDW